MAKSPLPSPPSELPSNRIQPPSIGAGTAAGPMATGDRDGPPDGASDDGADGRADGPSDPPPDGDATGLAPAQPATPSTSTAARRDVRRQGAAPPSHRTRRPNAPPIGDSSLRRPARTRRISDRRQRGQPALGRLRQYCGTPRRLHHAGPANRGRLAWPGRLISRGNRRAPMGPATRQVTSPADQGAPQRCDRSTLITQAYREPKTASDGEPEDARISTRYCSIRSRVIGPR